MSEERRVEKKKKKKSFLVFFPSNNSPRDAKRPNFDKVEVFSKRVQVFESVERQKGKN